MLSALGELDGDSLRAFAGAIRLGLEGDPLTVIEVRDAGLLEGAHMDEDVLGRSVGRDKAEAFGRIEEFYGACLAHVLGIPCPVGDVRTRHAAGGRLAASSFRERSVLS